MDQLKKSAKLLSLWQVVIIGVAYLTPMTVFDTFGIVSERTNGRVPLAYLFTLVAILLTAMSYSRLAATFPESGSAFTYTGKICGKESGFIVGWATLQDYMLLPMINALLSGAYLSALFPDIPTWILITVYVAIVTFINSRNVSLLANMNFIFVGVPLILTIYFIYLVIHIKLGAGWEAVLTAKPLFNGDNSIGPLVGGAAVLCFSFLGFDAVSTLASETKDSKTTIPRAIMITVLAGGIIFFISAWFIQLYYPTNELLKNYKDSSSPEIAFYVGGALFQKFFMIAMLVNTFASALASHASAARLLHIMGIARFIPGQIFRYVHPKYHSPYFCVLLVGFLSLAAIFCTLDTAVSFVNFGAMIAFSAVNICILVMFAYYKKQFKTVKGFTLNIILPVLGLTTVAYMWLNLQMDSFIFGLSWTFLGLLYLLYLKKYQKALFVKEQQSFLQKEEDALTL
ncbi:APC family permease [Commensalibacter papalotli (ex Botero et al. 2024)]|nr:APC family permease [Commensalibacter papalotli (ex Botero et al. 2024)]CAI3930229.1 Serine transporter YbeC [Commensalibacter papalotli (ex Botero et al. 2024)]CAI3948412.1 Serine transporter YbeC [Commensalibacter papalotli (ex Botero et al. 2024)]